MRSSRTRLMSVMALAAIGSLGTNILSAETGPAPEPNPEPRRRSNHWPHQGKKECARRLRRLQAGKSA